MNSEELLSLLKLPPDAQTDRSFDELGVDSWSLVELRATLESRHGVSVPDDLWLELDNPDDVLRLLQ